MSRSQLLDAGVSKAQIRHRLGSGSLLREHRGVYRAGHRAPSTDASYLAAVYACGADAVLGGLAATHLYGVTKGAPPPPEVHAPIQRAISGVVTHRALIGTRDATIWRGIPTVTVPRALIDVAGRLGAEGLARACHEAGVRFQVTPRQVEAALCRRPNAPGAGTLRAVMSGDVRVSLSRLESRFLELLRAVGSPLPVTNEPAGGRYVDCRWPQQRVTVELDSYRFHNSRHTWERDRAREREAYARGDQFRRFTWGDVFEHPSPMMAELRALL